MIIGDIFLSLALAVALVACYYYFLAARGQENVLKYARWASAALALMVVLAAVYLMALILSDQFQVEYVFENSASTLPLLYKVSAFWGGQEGSILLWLLWGVLYGLAMSTLFRRRAADGYEARTMFFMSAVQLFPLVMLMMKSPFRLSLDPQFEGNGLNPLLQDPYMVIHPPILFLGFAGLSTAFSYAMAGLWKRDYSGWVIRAWPWTLAGWGLLGLGLSIGGFWAYRVLGWGGYWGWDPVENSSLVPWLLGGALIHGMIVQKTRGRLVRWNLLLALATYVLVIYSTFLTRSGVLADFSVHTFGASPLMPMMVASLLIFTGVALWLYVTRYREIAPGPDVFKTLLSRDFTSLITAITFIFGAVAVTIGTSSPIITGMIAGSFLCTNNGILMSLGTAGVRLCTQSNVATSYYSTMSIPLGLVLAIIMTIAPLLAWQETHVARLIRLLRGPFLVAVVGTLIAAVLMMHEPVSLFIFFFSLFALGTNVVMIVRIYRANIWKIGGYLAHVGVALALVGIIGSTAYKQTERVTIYEGQSAQALGYSFQFNGLDQLADGKYAMQVVVKRGNEAFLSAPKLLPTDQGMVRNPDIHKYLTEDLYVSPGDYDPGKQAGDLLTLQKGESQDAQGYSIKFVDYTGTTGHEMTQTNPIISVGAILAVTKDGVTTTITPTVSTDAQQGLVSNAVTLPGTTIQIGLDTPQVGQAIISVLDTTQSSTATPPFITLEISREPGINLLWAGLIIIALGVAVAVVRRRGEEQRASLAFAPAQAAEPSLPAGNTPTRQRAGKQGVPQPTSASRIP